MIKFERIDIGLLDPNEGQIVQKDNSSFGAFDYDILRSDWMGFGYDYASWGLNLDTQEIELEPKEAKDDAFDVDAAAEAIKTPVTQRGDIWQLGRHTLMCGDSTRKGATVIDLFGGSGSTLMACEQLDRTCRTMEYDPKYCDVIIQRWEKFTGRKAAKIKAV